MVTNQKIIKKYNQRIAYGQAISKLASSFCYVDADIKIDKLMNELNSITDLEVIGVVDDKKQPCGIVIRQELMEKLSQPFGRDVLCKYPVSDFAINVQSFLFSRNIFSVADEINSLLHAKLVYYFILLTEDNEFAGIFSTRDMHIYLADNTKQDMLWAREVQTRIVQEQSTTGNSVFEAVSIVNMAKHVGGDFYSIKHYTKSKWLFSLCDVSGKGIAASLVTAILGGMFQLFNYSYGIKKLIKELNSYLYRSFNMEIYVTGVFIDFDEKKHEIIIYDMGHSHLFLFRKDQLYRLNSVNDNPPLGIVPEQEPYRHKLKMKNGEILFITTDGLLEQKNISGKTYSISRVCHFLKNYGRQDLLYTADSIKRDFHNFRGKQNQADDVAFIFFKYKKEMVEP